MKIFIKAQSPYDFDLSCLVFSDGDDQIRKYADGRFWQVLRVNDKLIQVTVESVGNVLKPVLSVELKSNDHISDDDKLSTERMISNIFNTDFDLDSFYQQVKDDKVLSKLSKELFGLKTPTTPTVFEALVDSIVEQQISLKAAHSIEGRIIKTFGSKTVVDGQIYFAFPKPEQINNAPSHELRECGLTLRKAEYIKDISKLMVTGKLDLEKFKRYKSIDDIIDELSEIRGIGKWTAELTIIRGLNGLDSFPADDIGIRRVISHYYCHDQKISADKAREIAKRWGKWKGLASYYLIIGEMSEVK